MWVPEQHSSSSSTTRRRFLTATTGVAVVLAAGCRPLFKHQAAPARPDPDVTATERALGRQQALLAAYAAVQREHPGLASDLRAFSKRHEAHSAALRARLPAGHAAKRTATPTATPSDSTSATSPADLLDAEQEATEALAAQALEASPTLAQVLASMSACSAAHVELLKQVKR